jgi:hypothetical protein
MLQATAPDLRAPGASAQDLRSPGAAAGVTPGTRFASMGR